MSRTSDYLGGAVGPFPLSAGFGGGLVSYPNETFETPLLDLTVVTTGIEIVPAKPGHIPLLAVAGSWLIESFAGVQTAPGSIKLGSDPTHTNLLSTVVLPPNATLAAIVSLPSRANSTSTTVAANTAQRLVNTPVILDVISPSTGTGGFALKGRYHFSVIWAPVGG